MKNSIKKYIGLFKGCFKPLLASSVAFFSTLASSSFALYFIFENTYFAYLMMLIVGIILLSVYLPFFIKVLLLALRGESVGANQLMPNFMVSMRFVLAFVLITLVAFIICFVSILVPSLFVLNWIVISVFLVVLVLLIVAASVRSIYAFVAMVDKDIDFFEGIAQSVALTEKQAFKLLGICLFYLIVVIIFSIIPVIGTFIALAIFGLAVVDLYLTQESTSKPFKVGSFSYYFSKYRIAYYFIAPIIIGMTLMHFIPIVQGIYMSFLRLNNFTLNQYLGAPFVFIKNYYEILFDPASPMSIGILDSIRNTIFYSVIVTVGQIGLGMIVALMLTNDFKGRSLVRTLFLFSWIVPTYVTGILWGFMWQRSIGIINIIFYDYLKFHIFAEKINPIFEFFQVDKIISFVNYLIMKVNLVLRVPGSISFPIVKMVAYLIMAFVLYQITMFFYNKIRTRSKGLSVAFVLVTIGILILAYYKITFPTLLSTTFKPFWLAGPNTIWAIIIPTIWRYWPMSMLMLLAGLQNIPQTLYDAAKIDGANRWTAFWKITWPMLKPVWMILILFGLIYNVYSFNIVIMMFGNGAGFPGEWGDLMMTNIFRNSFMRWDFGAGAATSVMLLIVMIVAVNVWFKFYKQTEESYF